MRSLQNVQKFCPHAAAKAAFEVAGMDVQPQQPGRVHSVKARPVIRRSTKGDGFHYFTNAPSVRALPFGIRYRHDTRRVTDHMS